MSLCPRPGAGRGYGWAGYVRWRWTVQVARAPLGPELVAEGLRARAVAGPVAVSVSARARSARATWLVHRNRPPKAHGWPTSTDDDCGRR